MNLISIIEKYASPIRQSGEEYSCTYLFPADFHGFDGHFPENPILPGVIQTLLGEISSANIINKKFSTQEYVMTSITRCKFLRPVRPNEELELCFTIKEKKQSLISICKLTVSNETAASYQLIFNMEVNS